MEIDRITLAMANCVLQSYTSYRMCIVVKVELLDSNYVVSIMQGNDSPKFSESVSVYSCLKVVRFVLLYTS